MRAGRAGLGVGLFLVLSTGVAVNMFMLQTSQRSKTLRQKEAQATTARELVEGTRRPASETGRTTGTIDGRAVGDAKPHFGRTTRAGEPEAMSAETIRAVQRELMARGYEPGSQDGVAGLMTRAAILAFEHDHGLPLSADPSDQLLKAIVLGPPAAPARAPGAVAEKRPHVDHLVRTVQQSLAALGYMGAKPDGRHSDDLARAIREFEMDQGLPVTGRISGHLLGKLARAAASGKIATAK